MDITPQSPKGGAARFRNSGVSLVNLKESWRFYEELKKYLSEDVEEKLARSICAEVLGTDTNFQSNIEDYMSTASIKRHHFLEGTLCFWMSKVDAAQATGYSLFAMLESIDKRVAKSCEHFLKLERVSDPATVRWGADGIVFSKLTLEHRKILCKRLQPNIDQGQLNDLADFLMESSYPQGCSKIVAGRAREQGLMFFEALLDMWLDSNGSASARQYLNALEMVSASATAYAKRVLQPDQW